MLKRGRIDTEPALKRIVDCTNEIEHQADEHSVKRDKCNERNLWSVGPEARHRNEKPFARRGPFVRNLYALSGYVYGKL